MRLALLTMSSAAAVAMAPVATAVAQSARPVPTGPINVIRPSNPSAETVVDTSRTVFYVGPRPAPPAAEEVPGHELVTWRSSSPLVRGVAGADAGYLAAFEAPSGRGRGAVGRSAGPVFIGGGFWVGGREAGVADDPYRMGPRVTTPRVVGGDLPRPWIGGAQWNLPATPVVEPARNTAVYPIRRP